MQKIFTLTSASLILALVASPLLAYDCSEVIRVESEGLLNYLVNVTFPAPHNLTGEWIMDIETDVEYTFLGGWKVWVQNNPEKGKSTFKSRQDDLEIEKGETVTFRFRIAWFHREPKPQIISMIWDGAQICKDDGKSINEIKASRARRTSRNQNSRRRLRHSVN